jgi:hypothetical protein
MPETRETSSHKMYMIEGIILLVFELNLEMKTKRDHVAQILQELACE